MLRRRVTALFTAFFLVCSSISPFSAGTARAEDVPAAEGPEMSETVLSEESAFTTEETPDSTTESYGLSESIVGTPYSFELTPQEMQIKSLMKQHDSLGELRSAAEGTDYIAGEVFCLCDSEERAGEIAEAYGIDLIRFSSGVATFDVTKSGMSVLEVVETGADPGNSLPPLEANYIQENIPVDEGDNDVLDISGTDLNAPQNWMDIYESLSSPDPLLKPDDPNYQWWHDVVDSWAGWGLYGTDFSKSGIRVGVIDSGINATHEDLKGHTTQVATVGGGATTADGHGTHVAGIIGATAGNGKGGAGIAPGIQLVALNHTDSSGDIPTSYIIECLNYAGNNGINIVNMSFGSSAYDASEDIAIQNAYNMGVTLLASTGNDGATVYKYPAQLDHVIAVGAVQQDGTRSHFSTFGKGVADVYAPGSDMMSTYTGGDSAYEKEQGTSMSCPAAAGLCALYMSILGPQDPDTMADILTKNTIKSASSDAGAGIANIALMLGTDTSAPTLELRNSDMALTAKVKGGETGTAETDAGATLSIIPEAYGGSTKLNKDTQIFYTVNGKVPSFKDGRSNKDVFLTTDGVLQIRDLVSAGNGKTQKLTIKAVCVTGIGTVGKCTTIKLTVVPTFPDELIIYDLPGGKLAPGKTWQLQARLLTVINGTSYARTVKNGNWEIISGADIATVDPKKGLVTTVKGQSGSVKVKCTYSEEGNSVSGTATLTVGAFSPVRSIELSEKNIRLSTPVSSEKLGTGTSATVSIISVMDEEGNDITSDSNVNWLWKSSDTRIATVTGSGKKVIVSAKGKGNATVTCCARDGSGKSASLKVNVIQLVTGIEIMGQGYIAKGSTAKYKADLKAYSTGFKKYDTPFDKTVTWSLRETEDSQDLQQLDGISVDQKTGAVNVSETGLTSFCVAAAANDGSGVRGIKKVKVVPYQTKMIYVYPSPNAPVYKPVIGKKSGNVESLQLFTVDATSGPYNESEIVLNGITENGSVPCWTNSNLGVISISPSGDSITVRALKKGSSVITCSADDGSGIKAKIKVNVIVPVSHLMLTNQVLLTYANGAGADTFSMLGIGNSTKTRVTVGSDYGKPTNTKIKWEYEPVGVTFNDSISAYEPVHLSPDDPMYSSGYFSGSNGTVKFSNKESIISSYGVLVKAAATDGSGVYARKLFIPCRSFSQLAFDTGKRFSNSARVTYHSENEYGSKYKYPVFGKAGKKWYYSGDFSVTSSDPSVASGMKYYENGYYYLCVSYGEKTGKAKLTLTTKDGSGAKATLDVSVID